jgi:HAD superfamily hydrolase (TIGR01458 family)
VADIEGVLLDIDGVLAVSWEPLRGGIEALGWMRANDVPFRLVTNTTTKTRSDLADTLRGAGFDVRNGEIVTAVVATAEYLRTHHAGQTCFVLSDGDASDDLDGVELGQVDHADVIVLGGAYDGFTYPAMNRVFRRLMDGAALVGMHRNLYWLTNEGLELDAGAYLSGLEEAIGREAVICGKPTGQYFESALAMLGVPAKQAVMVGDDIVNDVRAAQVLGIRGALVKTGKFLPGDLDKVPKPPDFVLETIAELPALIEGFR